MIRTLNRKLGNGSRETLRRFGKKLQIMYRTKNSVKKIDFARPHLPFAPMKFLGTLKVTDPSIISKWKIRSINLLDSPCASCGSDKDVEVHHIRHIRTLNLKLNEFDRKAAAINRKQIPLCHQCHRLVHQGKYKGLSLKHLANSR